LSKVSSMSLIGQERRGRQKASVRDHSGFDRGNGRSSITDL
jgi:hypothetical protein